MRMDFLEGLVRNLEERIRPGSRAYLSKEEAYKSLKLKTGQDFGFDADRWRKWIEDNVEQSSSENVSTNRQETGSGLIYENEIRPRFFLIRRSAKRSSILSTATTFLHFTLSGTEARE